MVIISSLYNCFLKLTVQFLLTLVSGIFWHIPCVTLDGLHFPTSFMAHTMIVPPGCWVPTSDCSAVPLQIPLHNDTSGCWVPPATVHGSRLQSLVPFPYHNCNAGCWVIPQWVYKGVPCSHWFHPLIIIVTPGCWVLQGLFKGVPCSHWFHSLTIIVTPCCRPPPQWLFKGVPCRHWCHFPTP